MSDDELMASMARISCRRRILEAAQPLDDEARAEVEILTASWNVLWDEFLRRSYGRLHGPVSAEEWYRRRERF